MVNARAEKELFLSNAKPVQFAAEMLGVVAANSGGFPGKCRPSGIGEAPSAFRLEYPEHDARERPIL